MSVVRVGRGARASSGRSGKVENEAVSFKLEHPGTS